MSRWPIVPLGEILHQVVDSHAVRADQSYPNFGIYSFGRGLFPKPPISGATTSAKTLFRARKAWFIYSRLFAFEGAYGLVAEEFDGCFVSNEYPMFECDRDRVLPEYVAAYFKTAGVWEEVARLSTGMGDRRRRVQPDQFLVHTIPLPSVNEQRRLVARIDELAAKIDEAKSLQSQAEDALRALLSSARRKFIEDQPQEKWGRLGDLVAKIENGWSPACESRPAVNGEWGVLKVGAVSYGTFDPRENKALPLTLEPLPLYEIRPGDFLMSRANTTELVGACALVGQTPPKLILCDKIFRFDFRTDIQVDPRYLDQVLKSPGIRQQIESGASGSSPTMKNISKEKVLRLRIPHHSLSQQRAIVDQFALIQGRLADFRRLRSRTTAELRAFLPAVLDRAFKGEL